MQVCMFLEETRATKKLLTTLCYLTHKSMALTLQMSRNNGAMTSVIIARNLIKTCNDGPTMSLNRSLTLHPQGINRLSYFFHESLFFSIQVFILTNIKIKVASSNFCCWTSHQWTIVIENIQNRTLVRPSKDCTLHKVNNLPMSMQNFILKNLRMVVCNKRNFFWLSIQKMAWLVSRNGAG
jgi:hypothetical protein